MGKINLNLAETAVLKWLAEGYSEDAGFYGFATIMSDTGLDRSTVRKACRSLKRKGLAEFAFGLSSCDGDFLGSGYGATHAGITYADTLTSLPNAQQNENEAYPP